MTSNSSAFPSLNHYPNLTVALSKRSDGGMKITGDNLQDRPALARRQTFLSSFNIQNNQVVTAGLVHGGQVAIVNNTNAGQIIVTTDGLITNAKNTPLAITVADCLPIVLYDPVHQVVGLLHAGWRGLAAGIIKNAVTMMTKTFGTKPNELEVAIGPSIHRCHYQVGADVLAAFSSIELAHPAVTTINNSYFLDLPTVARHQLMALNLVPDQIGMSSACTACQVDSYFSFRKDGQKKGVAINAMMAVARLA